MEAGTYTVVFMSVPAGLRVPEAHKSKLYAGVLEDRPGMAQKPLDLLHGLSAISMEERNVLLSLERLDQLLQCERLHYADGCSKTGPTGAELTDYVVNLCDFNDEEPLSSCFRCQDTNWRA